jgi:integrase
MCSPHAPALSPRNLIRAFHEIRDTAGLPEMRFHDLRHAAISRLIAAGLSPVTVAAVAGHNDPRVTLRVYSHLFNNTTTHDAVREAMAGISS